ncbi:hypothetical protein NDU88_010329 [Pleurodeles waltl]|uniref:Uncharacterized protein n=1 Tax=Pleurodeles waltl TaxID=8319 RepID=A0AAV7QU39_PLEWA|nr:hypothetical protein NDU88_010329 [Pleurodeles waltl]
MASAALRSRNLGATKCVRGGVRLFHGLFAFSELLRIHIRQLLRVPNLCFQAHPIRAALLLHSAGAGCRGPCGGELRSMAAGEVKYLGNWEGFRSV